jgi:predicted DNA-binding protein
MIQSTQDNEVRIAPAKPRKRRNLPMQITMPPDERARLAKFVRDIGRPTSWVVREAVQMYIHAASFDVERLKAKLKSFGLNDAQIPPVPMTRIGRPRKQEKTAA